MAGLIDNIKSLRGGLDYVLPVGIIGILALFILPIPPVLLDLFLTFSITFAIIILFIAIYIEKPLDFSTFPSILLVATLLRLSLNVATTKVILTKGSEGTDAAGEVINSFGQFVVGGNYVVGLIVFAILVIINFVVITKGSGRIAEVAARFTLDAMPGKQMSIDADLNAGLIGDDEARERRKSVALEADFYGSMDGASKFVRGDAVAGLLITVINILAGLAIGVLQQGMTIGDAAEVYTILTIGDGLVAQIPALIISTAAGIVVSHVSSERALSASIGSQFAVQPKALLVSSGMLFFFALIPGLPKVPFFLLSGFIGGVGYYLYTKKVKEEARVEEARALEAKRPKAKEGEDELPLLDTLGLEVGYRLIPLVDAKEGGELLERIKAIRRQFAEDMGITVPPIHIKDNLQLKPSEYVFQIRGQEVARGELMLGHSLAIDPGNAQPGLEGAETQDPAFGLPALWIDDTQKEKAQVMGYTVVNHSAVVATHITEIVRSHSNELFGRQEVQALLDKLAKSQPKLVEELVPNLLTLGGVQKVLNNLLLERVSIRDIQSIVETLADYSMVTKDTDMLTEYVRATLARQITRSNQSPDSTLYAITLNQEVEDTVFNSIQEGPQGVYVSIEPNTANRIMSGVKDAVEDAFAKGYQPVLLVSNQTRRFVRRILERSFPTLSVMSHNEVADNIKVQTLKVVRF